MARLRLHVPELGPSPWIFVITHCGGVVCDDLRANVRGNAVLGGAVLDHVLGVGHDIIVDFVEKVLLHPLVHAEPANIDQHVPDDLAGLDLRF